MVCILLCFTSLAVCSVADDLTLFGQELNLFDLGENKFAEAYEKESMGECSFLLS